MNNPLVSIVVSAYNRPTLLEAALSSLLSQHLQDIEIIVQDDSTNSECEEIVSNLSDHRIRYTHNRPSMGTGSNLRAGYRKCNGKYFATLNDDDLYSPEYLETMVAALEANPALSLAFSDHQIIDASGNVMREETRQNSIHWGRSILKGGTVPDPIRSGLVDKSVPGMFAVFRAEAMDLDDFPDEVSSGYDYWLVYLAVRTGAPIHYCPERLTSYRDHDQSQTSSFRDPTQRLRFCSYSGFMDRRLLADPRLCHVWPDIRQRLARMYASAGFVRLRLQQRGQALKEFGASLRTKPNYRAVAGFGLAAAPAVVLRSL